MKKEYWKYAFYALSAAVILVSILLAVLLLLLAAMYIRADISYAFSDWRIAGGLILLVALAVGVIAIAIWMICASVKDSTGKYKKKAMRVLKLLGIYVTASIFLFNLLIQLHKGN